MRYATLPLAVLLVSLPLAALAQTTPFVPFNPPEGSEHIEAVDPSLVSCFDPGLYRFGSTPVVLQSNLSTVAQGSQVGFTGTITNQNDYPISNIAIYGKVLYRANPSQKDSFGPEVVDFLKLQDGITLKAHEVMPLTFSWRVPQDAALGSYELGTFVAANERFNLDGLSFTVDVVGGSATFNVVGSETGNTHIDVHQTLIGTDVVHGAAFPPQIEVPAGGAPVTVHLVNSSGVNEAGTISWKLYSWDTLQEANLIDSKQSTVTVPAGQNVPVSYVVNDSSHTVYDLLVEFTPDAKGHAHSVQAIRFVNLGLNTPRLNFIGATAYPAKAGDTAFACFHSTGTANAENVRVELSATSNNPLDMLIGRGTLATKTYSGLAPGNIYAVMAPLARASDSFTVRAKIYQDDKLLDDISVPYSCSESPEGCPQPYFLIGAAVLILIVGGAVYLGIHRRRPVPPSTPVV